MALITLVVVMGPISLGETLFRARLSEIGGTVLKLALGLIALKLELISFPVMLAWCGAAMFLCGWLALGKRPYQALLIGITLAVVVGAPAGDMTTALWRSQDVVTRLVAGDAVYGDLAATRLSALAHQMANYVTAFLLDVYQAGFPRIWLNGHDWKNTCRRSSMMSGSRSGNARQQRNPYSESDFRSHPRR